MNHGHYFLSLLIARMEFLDFQLNDESYFAGGSLSFRRTKREVGA